MTAPLRVGLAGAGWVTQHHLAGWARMGARAKVVAIADPNAAAARARAGEFDIAQVFDSAGQMLDEAQLDAVDVAAPREFHAEIVRMAARKGLAVLCQKPLAPTLAQARSLVAEVEGRCRLMVHENWRFRPYYRDLAGWLNAGRIGDVVQGQMTLLTSGLIPDAQGQLPALARQPFVALLDRALVMEILIHHIDTLRFLLGDLCLRHARLGHLSPAMKGEDRAFLAFETATQAPIAMLANLAVHGQPPNLVDRLTLIGTHGTIVLDGDTLRCMGAQPGELTYDMPACYAQSYAAAIAHFVDCVASGAPFETAASDNLRTLELVESAYASGAADSQRG
ncbi:Gfo/Idh/MocA family protein [Ramlibacter sp. WS9]|uniref:Gfo/Idh/MocA family protein n=1 Tax=Ramlibacter sp. WS9 TaxID=1882741 RepID=UPI0011444DDD|nr:Gfo/Idh/MocA family oxidoreductase [Ramlibacter sp. WS9]ROZ77603.1 gfo/Idh/MocA family oxidoreductase [Ramlibacter sp. WS9]